MSVVCFLEYTVKKDRVRKMKARLSRRKRARQDWSVQRNVRGVVTHSIMTKTRTPTLSNTGTKNKDCIAFDFGKGLKKKNCHLYTVNKPRIGMKADTGGAAQYRYCVISPERRNNACGKKKICAKCQCDTGWGGLGCERNLASSDECSPLEPGCIKLPPVDPPCFG